MNEMNNSLILISRLISIVVFAIVIIATLLESKINMDDSKYSSADKCNNNNGIQLKSFETTARNGKGSQNQTNCDTQITVTGTEYNGKGGFKDAAEIMKESELTSSGRKCPSEHSEPRLDLFNFFPI